MHYLAVVFIVLVHLDPANLYDLKVAVLETFYTKKMYLGNFLSFLNNQHFISIFRIQNKEKYKRA